MKKCHYCGNLVGSHKTIDHIVPKSKGGEDSGWNKVISCLRCNQAKADSWPTCKCRDCQNSIRRHAAMGTTKDHPKVGWLPMREAIRRPGRRSVGLRSEGNEKSE